MRCSNQRRHFNPRSPHGERQRLDDSCIQRRAFQPTLPARGATVNIIRLFQIVSISTHAPRTGSDVQKEPRTERGNISTHAPRTGSDVQKEPRTERGNISTHAPRTGSDARMRTFLRRFSISTHAPRTGSDRHDVHKAFCVCNFNPRSPHGERRGKRFTQTATNISTHAPRTGSDV